MRRLMFSACILLAVTTSIFAAVDAPNGPVKYVFFMIGDGMGFAQVHSAEAYLNTLEQGSTDGPRNVRANLLTMSSTLPFAGVCTTYDYGVLITDSASAGTALACGYKTYSGLISVDPEDPNISYKTLAELAKEQGKKVGILSSVSLDHATPAVFYAHQPSRDMYFHIAQQAASSGTIDFIGGGNFRYIDGYTGSRAELWPELAKGDPNVVNLWTQFENNGFTVVHNLTDLQAIPAGSKCVAASDLTQDSAAMHYEIDRPASGEWSLAEVTAEAIRLLDNPNGFFMMVEGGKIDWTCHANDALTSIHDTIAFDDACRVVVDFANQHPGECLIVVTADHETGGMTMGWAGTKYGSAYENLNTQTMSFQAFEDVLTDYQNDPYSFFNLMEIILQYLEPGADVAGIVNLADDGDMQDKLAECFGVVYCELSELQQSQLEEAYDRQMTGQEIRGSEEDYLIYGGYSPLAVACTHIVNARAGLSWTSYSHTGVPVPVMSNEPSFSGYYDNTDVAKKIAVSMGGKLN